MADLRYLKRRRQSWYFRIAVPTELQAVISPGRKLSEIVETLGTRDLTKAQSLRWARRECWEQEFRRLRGEPIEAPSRPPKEIYRETVQEAEAGNLDPWGEEGDFSEVDIMMDLEVEGALRQAGASDEAELAALPADVQARLHAWDDYRTARQGRTPARRIEYTTTVSEAAEGFLREIRKTAAQQTIGQYEAALRLFSDFVRDKPIARVSRRDVARFLDEIEQFDPNWGRSPKTKERSFDEIKELFQRADGTVGLKNRTLNRYLTAIGGTWDWAKRRGEASGDDPTSGLFKPVTGKNAAPYLPYPPETLQRLFAVPAPPNALLWELPLVALYSGMRLNEICSLDWADLKEEDDIPFFDIGTAKSEAGVRKVPVHPRLDWLLERRKTSGAVWPTLKPGGPDQKRSWYFSKRFTVFRREREIVGPGLKFHSFRKNAVQCLERARVPQNEAAEIVGHEKAGITYRVYNPDGLTMAQRKAVVEKIQYPFLETID